MSDRQTYSADGAMVVVDPQATATGFRMGFPFLRVYQIGADREAVARDLARMLNEAEETVRLRDVLADLIHAACPTNWGDDDMAALAWLEAERLTSVALPDPDYPLNAAARKAFAGDADA